MKSLWANTGIAWLLCAKKQHGILLIVAERPQSRIIKEPKVELLHGHVTHFSLHGLDDGQWWVHGSVHGALCDFLHGCFWISLCFCLPGFLCAIIPSCLHFLSFFTDFSLTSLSLNNKYILWLYIESTLKHMSIIYKMEKWNIFLFLSQIQ